MADTLDTQGPTTSDNSDSGGTAPVKLITTTDVGSGLEISPITNLLNVKLGNGLKLNEKNELEANVEFSKPKVVYLKAGDGTINIDPSLGEAFVLEYPSWQDYKFTIGTPPNELYGFTLHILEAKKMASIEWPSGVIFANGTAPNLSSANDDSIITFYTDNAGSHWICTWFNTSK